MDPISISESDIQDAKNLVDLHAARLKKLEEVCEIEQKIKTLDRNRSEWVKICSGTEENVVKKQTTGRTEKHVPFSKIINNIMKDNPDGITLDDIIKLAVSQSSKSSKNFSSTCRQYIYNMKKRNLVCRDDSTFKYRLINLESCESAEDCESVEDNE